MIIQIGWNDGRRADFANPNKQRRTKPQLHLQPPPRLPPPPWRGPPRHRSRSLCPSHTPESPCRLCLRITAHLCPHRPPSPFRILCSCDSSSSPPSPCSPGARPAGPQATFNPHPSPYVVLLQLGAIQRLCPQVVAHHEVSGCSSCPRCERTMRLSSDTPKASLRMTSMSASP